MCDSATHRQLRFMNKTYSPIVNIISELQQTPQERSQPERTLQI